MNNKVIVSLLSVVFLIGLFVFSDSSFREMIGIKDGNVISQSKTTTINQTRDGVESAVVRRVVDGDTVELEDGRKVRLLNMDTPETVKENTPVMCYGYEASQFTKKILTGKNIQMVSDKEKTDKFGRHLRLIFLSGQDISKVENSINYELALNGYARVREYKPNVQFEPIMREAESKAKRNRVGVWGACQKPFVE
jgi:micrococcal nuclease